MKVADASLTSGWETELARIERGELSQGKFLDGVLETVNEVTGEIFRNHPVEKRPQEPHKQMSKPTRQGKYRQSVCTSFLYVQDTFFRF